MDQMEQLWAYMQEDIKADKIAQQIRRSALRQKLEKTRDFILRQQNEYKNIEEQVAVSVDRADVISDAIRHAEEQLQSIMQRFEENPPQDQESAHAMVEELEKCRRTIQNYEKEIREIHKASNLYVSKVPSITQNIVQRKAEFDTMKAAYSKETESLKKEEDAQRALAAEKAVGISPELMEAYNAVKRQISPPMALLHGGMCTGCNTTQPNAALRRIEQGEGIVECETCGRILIMRRG